MIRSLQEADGLKGDNEDQNIGISTALKAMEAPIRQIVMNAGEEASVVVDKIKSRKEISALMLQLQNTEI